MRKINVHSLVFKQFCYVTLGLLLAFGGVFFILRMETERYFHDVTLKQGEEIRQSNVSKIDRIFSDSAWLGDITARRLEEPNFYMPSLPIFLKHTLSLGRETRPEIIALAVAYEPVDGAEKMTLVKYENGEINIIKGSDYLEKDWYTEAKSSLHGVWHEPFIGDFIKEPIAVYTKPFYRFDEKGQKIFMGVVCVDISLKFLSEAVSQVPIRNEGYAFILSETQRIIAHPNKELLFTETLSTLADKNLSGLSALSHELGKNKSGLFIGRNVEDVDAFIYYTGIKSNAWTFGIVFPMKVFYERQRAFDLTFLLIGSIGFMIMGLVVFVISNRISRPIKALEASAYEIGRGNLDAFIPDIKSKDEIGMFAAAFRRMTSDLKAHIENMKNITAEKERIESELKVAQEIQIGILPKILPPFPKCEFFELDAFLIPAREVGGDLYDFFFLSANELCIVIGDVSGKGVPASLFMAVTQTLHRGFAHGEHLDPAELVMDVNNSLCSNNNAALFVTYAVAIIDIRTGIMRYCNAGHNPFFLMKSDGTVSSPSERHGIPLGVRENRIYGKSELRLETGDTLFFYTDGITEAKNGSGEFFQDKRLTSVLEKAAKEQFSPQRVNESVREAVAEFVGDEEQFDDMTAVALKLIKLAQA